MQIQQEISFKENLEDKYRIIYKYKVKTNAGKQSLSYMAIDIWKDLPSSLKDLSALVFSKYRKRYLLPEQKQNQFST